LGLHSLSQHHWGNALGEDYINNLSPERAQHTSPAQGPGCEDYINNLSPERAQQNDTKRTFFI